MPDISSIGTPSVSAVGGARPAADVVHHKPSAGPPRVNHLTASDAGQSRDQVDVSEHARLMDELRRLPHVRPSLVERVRNAITANQYETPQRLNATINALLAELHEDQG